LLKTHSCGEIRKTDLGKKVMLAGWVDRRRDHGGLVFIDLRDREGIVQVVFNPEISEQCHRIATGMRSEYVIQVSGEVASRPEGTENLKIPTGEIEIIAENATILNASKTPPFYINEDVEVDENVRLKYRYLDLRRARMRKNLFLRHQVMKYMRDFLSDRGFIEVETPILIKSTPEGARDYLVPSRVYPGKFYALPQSPQQMKQLLMVSGVDRYYQIARCFRDEDTRADRQPEFTQLDMEMSFIEEEDILTILEELYTSLIETIKPDIQLVKPFPRLPYADVMERYGTDKPDLRFNMELADLSDIVAKSEFAVFSTTVAEGGQVKGICAKGCAGYTRSQLAELNEVVKAAGAAGLLTISLDESAGSLDNLNMETVKSVAAKHLTIEQIKQMAVRLNAGVGDLLLIVAGKPEIVSTALGELRLDMGRRLELLDPNLFTFAFIIDFPLFSWNADRKCWDTMHHPFTSPRVEDSAFLETEPGKVRGRHYDMVCNGFEIAGGSIRIHQSEVQRVVFRLLGYTDDEINDRFGHLLEAFEYGAPPHGGVASGIDRFVMLLAGEDSIREVIPFPKNQNAVDAAFGAPATVSKEQLDELHLIIREEE